MRKNQNFCISTIEISFILLLILFLEIKKIQKILFKKFFLELQKLDKENEFTQLYAVTKNESINLLKEDCKIIDYENIDIPDNLNITNKVIADDEYNFFYKTVRYIRKKIVNLKFLLGLPFKKFSNSFSMPVLTIEWINKLYKNTNV